MFSETNAGTQHRTAQILSLQRQDTLDRSRGVPEVGSISTNPDTCL